MGGKGEKVYLLGVKLDKGMDNEPITELGLVFCEVHVRCAQGEYTRGGGAGIVMEAPDIHVGAGAPAEEPHRRILV